MLGLLLRLQHLSLACDAVKREVGERVCNALCVLDQLIRGSLGMKDGPHVVDKAVVRVGLMREPAQREMFDQMRDATPRQLLVPEPDAKHDRQAKRIMALCPEHGYAVDHDGVDVWFRDGHYVASRTEGSI